MPADNKDKVTILKLRKQKQNNVKTVGVTAYDYPQALMADNAGCLLYTSPSPRDLSTSRMPSSA